MWAPATPIPVSQKILGGTSEFGGQEALYDQFPGKLKARRTYPTFVASGKNKSADIEDTIARGGTPIITYKPPVLAGQTLPDTAGYLAGDYDAMVVATKNYLVSLNWPLTVGFWHEPHNEITPAEFIAGSHKLMDLFGDNANIAHGPVLNGFLLDSTTDQAKFAAFCPASLMDRWDYVAADCYQNGTNAAPGTKMPSRVAPNLVAMMTSLGYPNMPIGVGEYNALSAAGIQEAGQVFAETPTLWFALIWVGVANSTGITWMFDTPEEIAAFEDTIARFNPVATNTGPRKKITLTFGTTPAPQGLYPSPTRYPSPTLYPMGA